MSWRHWFATHLGPGALCGITLQDWLKLLIQNRFRVDLPYLFRAGFITTASVQNSLCKLWEDWRYSRAIAATEPEPPLFVLGIWRSGTTHLHNLLARDSRLAFPDFFDVFYPHTFLCTRWFNSRVLAAFLPDRRPQDNVRMAVGEPQEDEFALNILTQMSWALLWTFPRNAIRYERYLTFHDAAPEEIARWQEALRGLVKKLTYRYRKPLVLKSPAHTGRIRLLLDVFPEARFVHIHRHPYDVFQSSLHSARTALPYWTLQRSDHTGLAQRTLDQYAEIYDAYFEDRGLIPPNRLHEISYASLVSQPLDTLRSAYEALGLPDFSIAEPVIREYLDSIRDYERNRFAEMDPEWKAALARRCPRCFDQWGYSA
jgi:hypothetical protein